MIYCVLIITTVNIRKTNEDVQTNYGTARMIPGNPDMVITGEHYDLGLFEAAKVAKYLPNNLFSWPVLADSFHRRYPLEHNMHRQTIRLFIKNASNAKTGRFDESK